MIFSNVLHWQFKTLMLLFVLCGMISCADSKRVVLSLEDKISQSDAIVYGNANVIEMVGGHCRKAKIKPIKVIKGNKSNIDFAVKGDCDKLQEGKRYILFLVKDGGAYTPCNGELGIYYVLDNNYVSHINVQSPNFEAITLDLFIQRIKNIVGSLPDGQG